jgi:hypothetical protein
VKVVPHEVQRTVASMSSGWIVFKKLASFGDANAPAYKENADEALVIPEMLEFAGVSCR